MLPMMGDVLLGETFPHPMLWDFPGWLHCIGLEVFMYSPVETLPILQNSACRFVVVWNRRGMSSQLNLEEVRRETRGDEPSSDQKLLPVTGMKVAGVWRGRGHSRSACTV
jgi:hypothetical protein